MAANRLNKAYDTGQKFEEELSRTLNQLHDDYKKLFDEQTKLQEKQLHDIKQFYNEKMAYAKKEHDHEQSLQNKYDALKIKAAEKFYKKEAELKKKYTNEDGDLTKRGQKELLLLNEKFLKQKKHLEELAKLQQKAEDKLQARREYNAKKNASYSGMFGTGNSITERIAALATSLNDGSFIGAIGKLTDALGGTIDKIANTKSKVDTRLYGLNGQTSHWDSISKSISGAVGVSPYLKQETLIDKLTSLVSTGIAFNLEQRAFVAAVSENVASTFNAFNSNLLQLVRVQQADSTAARLGMEASLTSYLNSMYQNTEYLDSISKTVSTNLYEASSLMSATDTVGFEYQVQKWLGSLYSVGMSDTAIGNISKAVGALASGDLSTVGTDVGNLMVMAANRAGLSYSDILTGGLNEQSTNSLMYSLVDYIGSSLSSNNKVVQSQLAKVFGLSTSDIQAAKNLSNSIGSISNNYLNYNNAMSTLTNRVGSIGSRLSYGQMMGNVYENAKYGMSANIANNPALYAMYKASGLLDAVAGGGNLPSIYFAGTGVNLNTTVSDLLRFGSLGGGILSMIGQMIGAGSAGGTNGLLNAFGINSNSIAVTSRGQGLIANSGGATTSSSIIVGNTSGSDISGAIYNDADEQKETVQAAAEDNSVTLDEVNEHVVAIEDILRRIADGEATLKVRSEWLDERY